MLGGGGEAAIITITVLEHEGEGLRRGAHRTAIYANDNVISFYGVLFLHTLYSIKCILPRWKWLPTN